MKKEKIKKVIGLFILKTIIGILPSTRGAQYVDRDLYQSISKALW